MGIVGRNGIGISTLLRVILGQLAPTRGEAEIGCEGRSYPRKVDMGRGEEVLGPANALAADRGGERVAGIVQALAKRFDGC